MDANIKDFLENKFRLLEKNGWISQKDFLRFISDESINICLKNCEKPKLEEVFYALEITPLEKVKVLIIGQDPYPNADDAHGLAFSSRATKTPYSLARIFEAINSELGLNIKKNIKKNELTGWAEQGVLLLNMGLTHKNKNQKEIEYHIAAWRPFILYVLKRLFEYKKEHNQKLAIILWGDKAQSILKIFPNAEENFCVIKSLHPAYQGGIHFKSAKCFEKCDKYLDHSIMWDKL